MTSDDNNDSNRSVNSTENKNNAIPDKKEISKTDKKSEIKLHDQIITKKNKVKKTSKDKSLNTKITTNKKEHKVTITFIDNLTGRLVKNKKGTITLQEYSYEEQHNSSKDFPPDIVKKIHINEDGTVETYLPAGDFSVITRIEEYAITEKYLYIERSTITITLFIAKKGNLDLKIINNTGKEVKGASISILKALNIDDFINMEMEDGEDYYRKVFSKYKYNPRTQTHQFTEIPGGFKEVVVKANGYKVANKNINYIKPSNTIANTITLFKTDIFKFKLTNINKLPDKIQILTFTEHHYSDYLEVEVEKTSSLEMIKKKQRELLRV